MKSCRFVGLSRDVTGRFKMQSSETELGAIDWLLGQLEEQRDHLTVNTLKNLLDSVVLTPDEIRNAVRFSDSTYCRTKICSNAYYDVLIIGWRPGQISPIHDHAGSICAFRVIEGAGLEIRYEFNESHILEETAALWIPCGEVCSAVDNDIHQVGNTAANEDLVTLHIYSPPLKMNVYKLPETNA